MKKYEMINRIVNGNDAVSYTDKIALPNGYDIQLVEWENSEPIPEVTTNSNSSFVIKKQNIFIKSTTAFLTKNGEYVGHLCVDISADSPASMRMFSMRNAQLPDELDSLRNVVLSEGEDVALYVAESYRRLGHAEEMLDTMFEYLVEEGLESIDVHSIKNEGAMATYTRSGAEKTSAQTATYRNISDIVNNNRQLESNNVDRAGKKIFRELYKKNEDILETIDFQLLTQRYTQTLSAQQIACISCDKEFQEKLLALDYSMYDLFLACSIAMSENSNWITSTNSIINALQNPKFAEITESLIQSADFTDLATYTHIINSDENYFDIRAVEQLGTYHEIRNQICENIITHPENEEDLTDSIKKMSIEDRVRFARLEQTYGISLSQAKLLCQKYAFDITNSNDIVGNPETHGFLKGITQLINAESTEEIANIELPNSNYNPNETFTNIDTDIRRSYAEMYNSSFYQPREEDCIGIEDVNGVKVAVYNAGTDFKICSHVVGAFSTANIQDGNYPEGWNIPKIQSHVFCTRVIANEALEVAKEGAICYGFTDFDEDTLIASASWDMASIQLNKKFDTVREMDKNRSMRAVEGSGSRFLTPDEQINNTRRDGNETNWDRKDASGDKKQPSYVVFIAETLGSEEYKNDPLYQESLRASSQFRIPLVVIDRERVIENEHEKIDSLLDDYSRTNDPQTLRRVIQRFENNRTTGHSQKSEGRYAKEFPLQRSEGGYKSLEEIVKILTDIIESNGVPSENMQDLVDELSMQVVKSSNDDKAFYEIISQIEERDPSVKLDIDTCLQRYLGITQKNEKPQKISKYYFKGFYNKRENIIEEVKTPIQQELMETLKVAEQHPEIQDAGDDFSLSTTPDDWIDWDDAIVDLVDDVRTEEFDEANRDVIQKAKEERDIENTNEYSGEYDEIW